MSRLPSYAEKCVNSPIIRGGGVITPRRRKERIIADLTSQRCGKRATSRRQVFRTRRIGSYMIPLLRTSRVKVYSSSLDMGVRSKGGNCS